MGFFDEVREPFLDKKRDDICARLCNLGIDAQMAEPNRDEEKIGGKGSLGIIDIREGPIRWVNVGRIGGDVDPVSGQLYYTARPKYPTSANHTTQTTRNPFSQQKEPPIFGQSHRFAVGG
jgi:hypothetical protein